MILSFRQYETIELCGAKFHIRPLTIADHSELMDKIQGVETSKEFFAVAQFALSRAELRTEGVKDEHGIEVAPVMGADGLLSAEYLSLYTKGLLDSLVSAVIKCGNITEAEAKKS